MATTPHHEQIADDDPTSVRDDEDTLAEDAWAVPDQYRVEPEGGARDAWPNGASTVAGDERPRRFPPDVGPGLLLVLLAALLLVPAAIFASSRLGDDGDTQEATPTAPGTTTEPNTEPTTPSPPARVTLPDVVGDPVGEARSTLEEADLVVRTEVEPSDRPTGEVLRQSPAAETRAERGSVVLLTVSGGVERITVPGVVGRSQAEADRALREVGLRPDVRLVFSDEPAGTVVGQRPGSDARVDPDTVVRIDVAKARPETVSVPRLVGLPLADARSRLREAGLRSSVTRVDSTKPVGTVVAQAPSPGRKLEKGETVELQVSSGPAQVAVVDVVGLDELSAREQLEAAGFDVQVVDQPTTDVTEDGTVVAQDPAGGARADEGSVVTITVARLA